MMYAFFMTTIRELRCMNSCKMFPMLQSHSNTRTKSEILKIILWNSLNYIIVIDTNQQKSKMEK